ncbi:hypothetical protein PX617_004873 [Salmonella enterica subsp. enterica]|nr:hypothetical protein [Salmonella enterica subsp. enterica]
MTYNSKIFLMFIFGAFPIITYATSEKIVPKSDTNGVITQCSKYLPDNNKQYSINLDVLISAKDKKPKGELSVSDDSQKNLTAKEQKEISLFKNCLIKKLI